MTTTTKTEYHKKLAKIESTFLGIEDHGIFTSSLGVNYGDSSHQGVGGYSFDSWDAKTKKRVGSAFGIEFIRRTLEVCGVDSWEKVKGRTIYVLTENDSWGSKIVGIASLPTEGKEILIFSDLADAYK